MQESLSQDSTAKYWSQRYSLKETIPGFLANIAATILTTGKYLNVMRECGHNVQVDESFLLLLQLAVFMILDMTLVLYFFYRFPSQRDLS